MNVNGTELPEGLGFSLAMNQDAMKNFSNMEDSQKKQVIAESRQVRSKAEMNRIVNRLAEDSYKG